MCGGQAARRVSQMWIEHGAEELATRRNSPPWWAAAPLILARPEVNPISGLVSTPERVSLYAPDNAASACSVESRASQRVL